MVYIVHHTLTSSGMCTGGYIYCIALVLSFVTMYICICKMYTFLWKSLSHG